MSHLIDPTRVAPDGRDRRWDDHRQDRRRHLLDTAVALIDREGGDVGVAAICASAGVPRSVVYKLFRDREDLDEQIRQRIVRDLNVRMAPMLVPRGTARQMVGSAVRRYVKWVTEHPHLHEFLNVGSGSRPTPSTGTVYAGKATFIRGAQDLIVGVLPTDSLAHGTAAHLANALVGMVDATVNAWLMAGPKRSSAAALSRFLNNAACGIIEATATGVGTTVDLDAPVASFLSR